jgi:hypothetical protein
MQGYIEWIRLQDIPKDRKEIINKVDYNKTGPILYITNCCVRDDNTRHGSLWKLVHMVREKQSPFTHVCWHEDNGEGIKLKVYKSNNVEGGKDEKVD